MAKRPKDGGYALSDVVERLDPMAARQSSRRTIPCIGVDSTPDGYVVYRGTMLVESAEPLSPKHVRPWLETRPTDVKIPAVIQANIGGNTELKRARVVKGHPVLTQVGWEVVFGEAADSCADRTERELTKQTKAMWKARRTWWRHLCPKRERSGPVGTEPIMPERVAVPHDEACPYCGAVEGGKKASAA